MAVFQYKAKVKGGRIKKGTIVAASKSEAGRELRDEGFSPLFVKEITPAGRLSVFSSQQVPLIEKANLCRYLAAMIKSGLPLAEAIDVLCAEAGNRTMQRILDDIRASVQKGQLLSTAFSKYPHVFDEVFLTLVEAGEESGTLEKSFGYLGKQLYADYELRQRIKSTLAYPVVVTLATFGLGTAMLIFVVPRIAPVLLRLSETFPLPLHTLIILKVSFFLSRNVLVFLGSMAGGLVLLGFLFSSRVGRKKVGNFFSRLPVLRELYNNLSLARFSRTLSTLLRSGVPIIDALRVSASTLSLSRYQGLEELFSEEISKGKPLSEILKSSKLFPPMMTSMVTTGEKTGSLDKLLLELAVFYEEEISNSLKSLTSIIEPILMLAIGLGVGIIVVSIIAPIYSFVGSLSQSIGGG